MGSQELAESLLIHGAGCKFENSLRRGFLACRKTIAIELEKKYANDKSRALVTIHEGMIFHNTRCVFCRELDNVSAGVGEVVERPSKGGLQQGLVPQALCAAVLDELPIMDRQHELSVDPYRLAHSASLCRVFRYRPMISSAFSIFF